MTPFRLATAAVLSLAVASAPVAARPYYGHGGYHRYHGGGIGVGGALLGAAIIGGIAVAASNNNRRDREYYAPAYGEPGYADGSYVNQVPPPVYGQGYAPSAEDAAGSPVDDCSRAAEDSASARGGRARVTGIDRVDPIEGGANVLGTLELDRGQGYPVQRMGWSCRAAYGEVTGIRLG